MLTSSLMSASQIQLPQKLVFSRFFSGHPSTSSILDVLRSHSPPPSLESLLSTSLPISQITPSLIYRIINSKIPPSLNTLRFFIYSSTHRNPSPFLYSSLSTSLSLSSNPSLLHHLLHSYKLEQIPVSVKTFKILLYICLHSNLHFDVPLSLLKRMPEFGCTPDVSIHNSILRLPSINASSAYALLLDMKETFNLKPDLVTYVSVIKKLCLENRLDDARNLLVRMREEDGCVPNVVLYSALLDGACGSGDLEKGMEILEEMEREGKANVVSYTCLMKWLCESGRVDEALVVLDRMGRNGCRPNRVTFRTLIRGFCVEGRVKDACKVVEKLTSSENDGGVSSEEFHSLLALCLLRVGERRKAESLLCRMLEMNVRPDGVVCNTLLREVCEGGCYLDGYNWVCAFEEKGVNCVDNDVYSCLLEGLCKGGNWVEALRLGTMIVENEVRVEDSCIGSVVEAMEKIGEGNLASQILRLREENKDRVVA